MDWNAIVEQAWFQVAVTLIGIIAVSSIAMQWSYRNGYRLGVRVGKWLPGDRIEQWLVEFFRGLKEGLESTYADATVETAAERAASLPNGVRTELRINVKDNPSGGRASIPS